MIFVCLLAAGLWLTQAAKLAAVPNSEFTTINGQHIALAELKGKPVLITFWATDCGSCIAEIPDLIHLHQQYANSGLTIIAVAMYYDPPNRVMEMSQNRQLPYHIALDPAAEHAKAFGNVQFTPTTFLLDRNGVLVMQKTGRFELGMMQEQLKLL
jgi:thiol-disulfide isomerase/thioredoxin